MYATRGENYKIFGTVLPKKKKKKKITPVDFPLVKFCFTYSYLAGDSVIMIGGDFSFGQ